MTASETLKLIAKQWCSLSNLMKLAGVGRNNALYIKSTIKKRLKMKKKPLQESAHFVQKSSLSAA